MGPLILIHLGPRPHRPHVWIKPDRQNVTSACNWITDASLEWWLLHRPPALACVTQFWLNPACQPASLPSYHTAPQLPSTRQPVAYFPDTARGVLWVDWGFVVLNLTTLPHPHHTILSSHLTRGANSNQIISTSPKPFHSKSYSSPPSKKKRKQSNKRSPPLRSIFSEECSIFNLP